MVERVEELGLDLGLNRLMFVVREWAVGEGFLG